MILQIGIQPHFHVFLQVAVEELVIVQMIDSVGENGQHRRIFLWCYVRYLQSAALGVNIGTGELGNFSDDIAAVIGKAGTQVFFFPAGVLSVFQLRGLIASV